MRTELMPSLVGAFVLVGLLIGIGFVIYRVQEEQLQETQTFVMYFEGSMDGLSTGAEVTYRGIKVGEITEIGLFIDPKTDQLVIPVYIQLLRFTKKEGRADIRDYLLRAIDEGLRAQLYTTSFVTGSVGIRLVERPDLPAKSAHTNGSRFLQIPTIPGSERDIEIQKTLSIAEDTLKSIHNLVKDNAPQIRVFLQKATGLSSRSETLVTSINDLIGPSFNQFNGLMDEATDAVAALKALAKTLENNPESLLTGKR